MKIFYVKASIVLLLLFGFSMQTHASHFRYGHLTWKPNTSVSPTTAEFTLVAAYRWNSAGSPAVGDIITETLGETKLFFGDGNSTPILAFLVISIDPSNNWFLGVALEPGSSTKTTIDYTYATADNTGTPWLASVFSCCRTFLEQNNPNEYYRVSTLVELGSNNKSPISSLPAIVNLVQSSTASFFVPAADSDPNTTLTFRLATASEAGGGTFSQPAGLSINSVTGLVSWDTTATVLGALYSCQVIIEDRDASTTALRTQVAIDFLIEIVSCPSGNVAPSFGPTSPTCGTTQTAVVGSPFSFTVDASDPDAGDLVTLNTGGVPTGASMTPGLPVTTNPVSSVFSWTPIITDVGSHVVTFSATDICGAQTLCSYTVNVTACPNISVDAGADQTVYYGYAPAECATLTASVVGGTAPYSYLWSDGATTASITVCPTTTTTYSVDVIDANACTSNLDEVIVEVIDVRSGKNLDKVQVCHVPPGNPGRARTLSLNADDVAEHLTLHNDYLGACPNNLRADNKSKVSLKVYPNPVKSHSIIEFSVPTSEYTSLVIYDLRGTPVATLYSSYTESEKNYSVNLDANKFAPGLYVVILKSESYTKAFKLFK